jgi:hypothetical protein
MSLFLVAATNGFLAITIYRSRKSLYLFENSVLAGLAALLHGLNDEEEQEVLVASGLKKRTCDGLKAGAGIVKASFGEDGDGGLRLEKEV